MLGVELVVHTLRHSDEVLGSVIVLDPIDVVDHPPGWDPPTTFDIDRTM
jgi:hypothetical protein